MPYYYVKDCISYKINMILQWFYKSTTISMVCGVLVRQRSKEAHGRLRIDPLMHLLLFTQANSLKESDSGTVKSTSETRSSKSLNALRFSDFLSKWKIVEIMLLLLSFEFEQGLNKRPIDVEVSNYWACILYKYVTSVEDKRKEIKFLKNCETDLCSHMKLKLFFYYSMRMWAWFTPTVCRGPLQIVEV